MYVRTMYVRTYMPACINNHKYMNTYIHKYMDAYIPTYLPTYVRCIISSVVVCFFLSHLGIHCLDSIGRATLSVRRKSRWDVFYVQLPQHYLLAGRFFWRCHTFKYCGKSTLLDSSRWVWWRIQKFSQDPHLFECQDTAHSAMVGLSILPFFGGVCSFMALIIWAVIQYPFKAWKTCREHGTF